MNQRLNARLFDAAELWRADRDRRDWLDVYRQAEAEAELAAELVRAASSNYRRERSSATEESYRAADRAYDAARLRFQRTSFGIVNGVRAIAGIARVLELEAAGAERMV